MRKYCRAYRLGDLRQFPAWTEKHSEHDAERTDETIVYLWDDLSVVESPILHNENLFDTITPEWQDFCQHTLQFAIPEDLQYAYQDQAK